MKVKDVMTRDVEVIFLEASLVDAAEKMRDFNVGVLPVAGVDTIIGLVTDRDIVVRAVAFGKDVRATKVKDVMSRDLASCMEDDDLDDAAAKMRQHKIRRLLVMNENKKLVGILALGDLAVEKKGAAAEALGGISEPAEPTRH